jgi:hypothetical protein
MALEDVEKYIKFTLFILNLIIPFVLAFTGIFYVAYKVPSHLFEYKELEELREAFASTPLLDIIDSKNELNQSLYPLLGKYRGLKGGHKYDKCSYLFFDTCADYEDRDAIYCPTDRATEGHSKALDKSTCVDYPTVPETNYTNYKGKNLYAQKSDYTTYESLLKNAISKNEKCPEGHKKCGILINDLILCYRNDEDCPINDIIINNNTEYIKDNILYKTIEINENEYFHYTKEKVNNQIIFDLLLSLEHPLSQIELSEDNYDIIYKCHELEKDSYYKGNINNIKSYKQIYDTNITYQELLENIGIYNIIITEPNYRKQYFTSKMFIYKKYPIPISKFTYNEIDDFDSRYHTSFVLNFVSCAFLFPTYALNMIFILIRSYRFIYYILLTGFHICICVFFFLEITVLSNSDILQNEDISFAEKDHHRYELLCFHATYTAYAIFQNLCAVYSWIRTNDKVDGLYFKHSDYGSSDYMTHGY